MADIKDILSYPPEALHKTSDVARFIGRTSAGVRLLVKKGILQPSACSKNSTFFSTQTIRNWIEDSSMFKSGRGVPSLQKGPEDEQP